MSYTLSEKQRIKIILLWITTIGQASIALYLPALPQIAHYLGVSDILIKQSITVFIIGFGVSPIVLGALTDRYGRKRILLLSLSVACTGYIVNIFATNLHVFILARLISGIGCGGILIAGRSIIRDVFVGREIASASSYLSMGFAIGFGISPVIGGLLSNYFGWRTNFIFLLVVGLLVSFVVFIWLPETNQNKDNRVNFGKFITQTIIEYMQIIKNLLFMRFLAGGLFAYGVVLAYNVMTPFLILRNFSVSPIQYGYVAILMGIPYYVAASLNRSLVVKLGASLVCKIGCILIIFSGFCMLLIHFTFQEKLIFLILPMMMAIFGQAFIFSNTISGALQLFSTQSAGKVSAVFSSLQMLIVSAISLVMAILPNTNMLSLSIVIIVLGLSSIIILPNENK